MAHPLTPREEAALRRLAEEVERDDPGLADRLRHLGGPRRLAPAKWPSSVWVAIGAAFLVSGITLGVTSAVLGGLLALAVAACRSGPGRRALTKLRTTDHG